MTLENPHGLLANTASNGGFSQSHVSSRRLFKHTSRSHRKLHDAQTPKTISKASRIGTSVSRIQQGVSDGHQLFVCFGNAKVLQHDP